MCLGTMSVLAKQRPRDSNGVFLPGAKAYDGLLAYASVASWIGGYTAPNTRRNYLIGLNKICARLNLNPDQLVELARENGDKFPRDIKGHVKALLGEYVQEGKLGEAKKLYAAFRSFLAAHEVAVTFARQERIRYHRKKAASERILTKQEVYGLVDAVDKVKGWRNPLKKLRARALILCAYQSGVRPSCLVRWNYGLIKQDLLANRVPVPLKITSTTDSKLAGYDLPYYFTFLGKEGAAALREYIEARINRGATIDDSSPIFVTHSSNSRDKPLTYGDYLNILKRVVEAAGLPVKEVWPHLLRKSFRKVLNKADIDDDTREALMGHRIPGSRENYFDRHDIDDVAARYAQCVFAKETTEPQDFDRVAQENEELRSRVQEVEHVLDKILKGELVIQRGNKKET